MIDHFQNLDSWSGGEFDALMYFGQVSVQNALQIAERVWSFQQLNGPYRHRHIPTASQLKVAPDFSDDGCEQLVGHYRHVDGQLSPFVHTTIRGEDGLWIYAGVPMGGFPVDWNVGAYPFDDGREVDWTVQFTEELRSMTAFVRQRFPMLAAAYGWFDVSILDTLDDALRGRIHDDRWHAMEIQTEAGWQLFPATKLEPLFRKTT